MNNPAEKMEDHKYHINGIGTPSLSIVIPCHNEALVIHELYRRVTASAEEAVQSRYEVVLINDGSTDNTWQEITGLCEMDSHIVGVDLSRNFGHQLALSAGLEICKGDRILILDADLQDPPELLPEMMRALDNGADVAFGKRTDREGETKLKKMTASLFYRTLRHLTDIEIPLDAGDFRLMTRRVCDHLVAMPEKQRFVRGMVAWLGYQQVAIPYSRQARYAGTTKYSLGKMVAFALDAITSFSTSPIKVSVYFSVLFILISLGLMAYVLVSWIYFEAVPGWASIGVMLSFIGAAQFFVLGMIGEYVGRIYTETKGRPLFLVRSIVTTKNKDGE